MLGDCYAIAWPFNSKPARGKRESSLYGTDARRGGGRSKNTLPSRVWDPSAHLRLKTQGRHRVRGVAFQSFELAPGDRVRLVPHADYGFWMLPWPPLSRHKLRQALCEADSTGFPTVNFWALLLGRVIYYGTQSQGWGGD
jgi:hypothetical protein